MIKKVIEPEKSGYKQVDMLTNSKIVFCLLIGDAKDLSHFVKMIDCFTEILLKWILGEW